MNEPVISIGILTEKEIRFDLYGDYTAKETDKKISGKFKAKLSDGEIEIFQDLPNRQAGKTKIFSSAEINIVPNDLETKSFLLRDVVIGKGFHWEKKENQRFRGILKFIKERDKITAVNILPLEEYLTSVISSEMSATSSFELLKAHSIISRGWILSQLEKKNKKHINERITDDEIIRWYDREDHAGYDFCADDHCQRYQGATKIVSENAISAIDATRGLVLKYKNEICDTRYSKCCGGVTESFENVWEPMHKPYLCSTVDYKFVVNDEEGDLTKEKFAERWIHDRPPSFCNIIDKKILSTVLVNFDQTTDNFFRWKVEYTQNELVELIKSKSGIDFGNIIDLIPIERGNSARIIRLEIVGSKKAITIGKELEIRKTLSPTHLYSSAFVVLKENVVDRIPQKFILHGAGWGHGVGLCQIGAAVMGELGYFFDEILTHYFKDATIQRIY